MVYKTKRMNSERKINNWLEKMSKLKSFKPISISVSSGCGIWYAILYSINKRDASRSISAQ